jgi:hypothetical protein
MWPILDTPGWLATRETLHLWMQLMGKISLALAPMTNHWWGVALHVSNRGFATPLLPIGDGDIQLELDFIDQRLYVRDSHGRTVDVALRPRPLADFYREVVAALAALDLEVPIWPVSVELPERIRFDRDRAHRAYDRDWATRFWQATLVAERVLAEFRTRFIGKASPVHFMWGSFDLCTTRFSGRRAPLYQGPTVNVGLHVMQEAYSHEVCSAGFWPGDRNFPEGAFYTYAYPEPPGFAAARVEPYAATYVQGLREFLLPYAAVRASPQPEREILAFLQSTYDAAAHLGHWDRAALERTPPRAGGTRMRNAGV